MSKIDDTLEAISNAKQSIGSVVQSVSAAINEAQETENLLVAVGAEANAESLAACRETLEGIVSAVSEVEASLDEATLQAEAAKG